jgi:hypothetical protein
VTGESPARPQPASLSGAIRLLLLEAAGLAGLTAYLIVRLLTADNVHVGVAVALIVLAALGAAAVAVVARSLSRRSSGARGPAIVVQLFVIASGGFLVQTGPLWLGWLLIGLGLLTGLLIVLPASTRALGVD